MGNPGRAVLSGIIRDGEKLTILSFSGLVGVRSVDMAAMEAVNMGLQQACSFESSGYLSGRRFSVSLDGCLECI